MYSDIKNVAKEFCDKLPKPAIIMDDSFNCVYSNCPRLIKVGNSMTQVFMNTLTNTIKETTVTIALIKGVYYSARVIPIDELLFIVELFDEPTIHSLCENTNFYERIYTVAEQVEHSTGALWSACDIITGKIDYRNDVHSVLQNVLDFKKYLLNISSVTTNITEYANMVFPEKGSEPALINIKQIAAEMVERCNTLLAPSRRYIDILFDEEELYIKAHTRYVISALINALQNALLYSPKACVPNLNIRHSIIENKPMAVIQITNENNMCIDKKHGDDLLRNFTSQRSGLGIPIIKRFVNMCGGTFSIDDNDGKVCLIMNLPAVSDTDTLNGAAAVNTDKFVLYTTRVPDIIMLKMMEVNALFS